MLLPETSTTHSRLPAVPRRRQSAALRTRSSCLETSGSRSAQDPICTADDQKPPIQNDSRALECDWPCAGGRCHEKAKTLELNFPRRLFLIALLNFFNVSQYLSEFTVEPRSRKSTRSTPSLSQKNGRHDHSCWQSLQTFLWSFGRTCVSPLHRLFFGLTSHMFYPSLVPSYDRSRSESPSFSWASRNVNDTAMRCFLWSSDKSFGTHLAQNLW